MNISELIERAYSTAKAKGWHSKPATFGDRIALIHSEASEALEAFRSLDNDSYDAIRSPIYRSVVTGNLTRSRFEYVSNDASPVRNKPEGVVSELADIIIRVADLCGLYGIDLQSALDEKLAYNETRSYRHGGKQL